ncbi:MAG TPA: hypothetical protein VFO16_04780 [Pseudonocardiaceae bacterium]|nr:hypothetical protein [Pseudonocardiaceae bacterium]
MWEVIAEILERRWSERQSPRRQLVKDITTLYRAMSDSMAAYEEFCHSYSDKSRKNWDRHVNKLVRAVKHLDPALEIFAPAVRPIVGNFTLLEYKCTEAEFDPAFTVDRSVLIAESRVILHVFTKSFDSAHRALREFIRENFTIEEIHAAFDGWADSALMQKLLRKS